MASPSDTSVPPPAAFAIHKRRLRFLGLSLDTAQPGSWLGAAAVLAAGLALFVPLRRRFAQHWGQAQSEIERELRRRETA